MAFTVSALGNSVFGNKNIRFLRVTADGLEASVASGFGVVDQIVGFAPQSMTTAGVKIKMNQGTTATASNGNIAITGCTTGDILFLTVSGR